MNRSIRHRCMKNWVRGSHGLGLGRHGSGSGMLIRVSSFLVCSTGLLTFFSALFFGRSYSRIRFLDSRILALSVTMGSCARFVFNIHLLFISRDVLRIHLLATPLPRSVPTVACSELGVTVFLGQALSTSAHNSLGELSAFLLHFLVPSPQFQIDFTRTSRPRSPLPY